MEIKIDEKYDGARVDRLVKKLLSDKSMSQIFKMFKKGDIRVNGKKVKENIRLNLGDLLYIYKLEKRVEEDFIKLTEEEENIIKNGLCYEDKNIFVFNKPYGLVMHKGSGFEYGLVEIFKSYYKNNEVTFVNRLDKDTSGLVVGSKNIIWTRKLTEIIRERNINKHYFALVKGKLPEENIKIEVNMENTGKKMEVIRDRGKKSITIFREIYTNGEYSVVEAILETGRKHQIRVHLSHIKHPIVGDKKYGGEKDKRMYLHSYKLEIPEISLYVEAPIPREFMIIIEKGK